MYCGLQKRIKNKEKAGKKGSSCPASVVLVRKISHHMGMIMAVHVNGRVFFDPAVMEGVYGIRTLQEKINVVGYNNIGNVNGFQYSNQFDPGVVVKPV